MLEQETLDTLKNIEYMLKIIVGQNANNKYKLEKDNKISLKQEIYSESEK